LIGDAGCHVKFSGGGIIPAIMAAEAAKEIIVNKDYKKLKRLNRRTLFNKMATKMIWKMNDKDFDDFFEILKDKKFQGFLGKRDELEKKEYFKLLDRRLLKFFLKTI
jgi:flavin-dependent dehydrogenase